MTAQSDAVVHRALLLYLEQTDGYLHPYREHSVGVPSETDACCPTHLARWQRDEDALADLQKRRDEIVAELRAVRARLEAAGERRGW